MTGLPETRSGPTAASGDASDRLPRVREWRVHLGVHKTATTHLQKTLALARERLAAEHGIDYLPMQEVRPVVHGLLHRRRWRYLAGGRFLQSELESALGRLRLGPPSVLVSEENLLGLVYHILVVPRPLPLLERRVRAVATLGRGADLTLFLSIRRFDEVYRGAYVTGLNYFRLDRQLLEAARRAAASRPPRWTDIIRRIQRAAPGARLRVWRQEDYARDAGTILAGVLGRPVDDLPRLPPPEGTVTPPAAVVEAIEDLHRTTPRDVRGNEWARRVDEVLRAPPAGTERFSPFPPADVDRCAEAYAEDLAEMRRTWPGMLIEPAVPGGDAAGRAPGTSVRLPA